MVDNSATPLQKSGMCFRKPLERWDEGIPLGNGLMGCIVWGDGNPLRMGLDRGDLWDGRAAPETLSSGYNYKELIKLVENRDQDAIVKGFDAFYFRPEPTKIPAGALELDFGRTDVRMESSLSLPDALCTIDFNFDGRRSSVKTFLHATEHAGFIKVTGNAEALHIRPLPPNQWGSMKKPEFVTFNPHSFEVLGYPPAVEESDGEISWFVQKTCEKLEYAIVVARTIKEPEILEAVYMIASNTDGEDWLENAKRRSVELLEAGFDKAFIRHSAWWEQYWSKSRIELCDKQIEQMWYVTNYFFGSCSRKSCPPMPLQGIWTADDGKLPPWKGDYHHDLNTQMSYWHYMKSNHMEEGESFIDFLWKLLPEARKFARDFFDAPGICLPSCMTIDGTSVGGWVMYATNLVNQIWLCQAFDHYWQYSGSRSFLEEKAYPYFKLTAECVMRWLTPGPDGKLVLPLSSSPEIHDNTIDAWLTPNSNYDLALLIYLFKTLADMSGILQNGEEAFWKGILDQLPGYAITEDNILMLSPDECLKESHRHHAHAMAIHPLRLLDYDNISDRKVIDATVANLEMMGMGLWVGFSYTWMSEFYSIQGNGEGAAYQLKLFWENFCSRNGFHLNGDYKKRGISWWHYRPFTLESNMCAADALQEMLLQDHHGVIRVFPAIPQEWKENGAAFGNFRIKGGTLVSSSIKYGRLEKISLLSGQDCEYRILNSFSSDALTVECGGVSEALLCTPGESFIIRLSKGRQYTIREMERKYI